MKPALRALAALLMLALSAPARAETLQQIISRENVLLWADRSSLTLGRDGMIYLCTGGNRSFVLRMSPDGRDKFGAAIVYAAHNATANADGVIASANAHFAHKVTFYDKDLNQSGQLTDFLVSDQVGWDAPAHVEAGASGDFYAVDQHRDRILRIGPNAKLIQSYPIPRRPAGSAGLVEDFRVCEERKAFYVHTRSGLIRVVGFDGKDRWEQRANLASLWYLNGTAFDVDDDGTLYILENRQNQVRRFSRDGAPLPAIELQMAGDTPGPRALWFNGLRRHGDEFIVRRADAVELFRVYDRTTGALKRTVTVDHERLTVTFPSLVWNAAEAIPFKIAFSAPAPVTPRWRVWARPFGAVDYREFDLTDGSLHVPADAAGLYRIKVTPETQPVEKGEASEYLVQSFVEIRRKGARGTLTVLTPESRVYYGRGEPIAFSLVLRSAEKDLAVPVKVRLTAGTTVIAAAESTVKAGSPPVSFRLEPQFTNALAPGRYLLTATAAGLTCVPQHLQIGPGIAPTPFHLVQYGDYQTLYPSATPWNAPDVIQSHLDRVGALGMNLMVDRIGSHLQVGALRWDNQSRQQLDALRGRLGADPAGVAPEKVATASPLCQTMAAYSSRGIREMAILMNNDAGLPLGSGFDNRKPEQLVETIRRVTEAMKPYPAFRGWTWSSNWWVFNKRGANAAKTPAEKAAYVKALDAARKTGAWAPALDTVSGYRLGYAVDAQALFNRTLKGIAPGLVTAVAAPYRNVESYPPVTFSNVDEIDLHIQWEQIGLPCHAPHNVDFYMRPGKPGWGHPEIWNDSGTGDQIGPTLWSMVMRGASGVGCSGAVPPWAGAGDGLPDDPRIGHYGTFSVFTRLNASLAPLGPWVTSLENDDDVAIVASGRMFRIDEWCHPRPKPPSLAATAIPRPKPPSLAATAIPRPKPPSLAATAIPHTGRHFARVFEAWLTCLYAHRPASIVFAEDLKPDSLKRFKAILVVDQQVEMTPPVATALRNAKAAGTAVFHDGTCRKSLVGEFTPLGISFDKLEDDPSSAGDDAAYLRFPAYARANLAALLKTVGPVIQPVAGVDNDEILLSRRKAGKAHYVFVVNNTIPKLDPGQMWRMSLFLTNRVPMVVPVRLNAGGGAVYRVFEGGEITPRNGIVQADLRTRPAEIFAVLPAAIDRIELSAPATAGAGDTIRWRVRVLDATGRPIDAAVPIKVRLEGPGVPRDSSGVASAAGATGSFTVPLNAGEPRRCSITAVELLSSRTAELKLDIRPASLPAKLTETTSLPQSHAAASATVTSSTRARAPLADRFGPHFRDAVLSDDGSTALLTAMNWDHNLYALDPATGKVRWRSRIGHYFAFSPQAIRGGFAVQGFDFNSAEGYFLYLIRNDGTLERRFALYGLPKRLPHRFVPGIVRDRIDNFAVPRDGSWVASAGDLGLAVWQRDGRLLWKQDWWKTRRHTAMLSALGDDVLLIVEGTHVSAVRAADGAPLWDIALARTGDVTKIAVAPDGKTVALLATTEDGRVFVIRNGRLVRALPTSGNDLALSRDASTVVVASANQLKLYSLAGGLQWIFSAGDRLRFPRFSPDEKRIVTTSDMGRVFVLDPDGRRLSGRDMRGRAVPLWPAADRLVLATWTGAVWRMNPDGTLAAPAFPQPAALDMTGKLLTDDGAPTTRIDTWGNAAKTPSPIAPNLLAQVPVRIEFVPSGAWGGRAHFARDTALLHDGKPDAPPRPWIDWNYVGFFAETSPFNCVLIDAFRTQLEVAAVTFFEDPRHPESWLRDASLEYWDVAHETWGKAMPLLSNATVHTHVLPKPIRAARFRIVLPWGIYGNLRLREIVFHGRTLGPSHPDAAGKRPVAVLFDEESDFVRYFSPTGAVTYSFTGARSGGRSLTVKADAAAAPTWTPPFGQTLPNWDFEIAEKPAPGQYRYLQFAWKALGPDTRGITLQIGSGHGGLIALHAGELSRAGGWSTRAVKLADFPPAEWAIVQVDLWDLFKKPVRIRALCLGSRGGPAAFDQIMLGRSLDDLKKRTPGP